MVILWRGGDSYERGTPVVQEYLYLGFGIWGLQFRGCRGFMVYG